jgi:hypothetical protein
MKLKDCLAIIIYTESRLDNVKVLQDMFPNNLLWEGFNLNDIDEQTREKYCDLKYFHRLQFKNRKIDEIIKHCAYALKYKEVLEYIYNNKLKNVIVFEDDAEFIGLKNDIDRDIKEFNKPIYYLGGFDLTISKVNGICSINKKKVKKIIGLQAVLYNNLDYTKNLLQYYNNPKKFKQCDYLIAEFNLKNNIDIGYELLFIQKESYTTKNIKMNNLMLKTQEYYI